MKKYLYLTLISFGMMFYSCGSDETKNNPNPIENPDENQPVEVVSEWEPSTIQLIKIIPLYTLDYPHTANCTKDFLQLFSNNTAKFLRYENAECKETEYDNAFTRNGNNVSLTVLGYQISGTISAETETKMEISSDISQYAQLISTLYPDYVQYLSVLEGGTVKLTLNKK